MIDDRLDIFSCLDDIPFPIREGFVEVEDRFVFAEGDLIKKGDMQSELGLKELAMTQAHGDDEITSLNHFLCQCSRNMGRWVGAFEA